MKFGFYWQAIEGDLLNAEIYLKSGNFKDSLFIVLDCIEKLTSQNGIEMLKAKLLLAQIHIEMNNHFDSLNVLNEIKQLVFQLGST